MGMEITSLGTRNAYGPRARPETNGGVTSGVDNERNIDVQMSGVAAEIVYTPYWNNTQWVGFVNPHTLPAGTLIGLFSVDVNGVRTQLLAPAAFTAAVFTTAVTGIDARVKGELPAGVAGYLLSFSGATAPGRFQFEVEQLPISPKTLPATR